jgi:hypothetical protein
MEEKLSMVSASDVHKHDGCDGCPECRTREKRDRANEELAFAFLLSLLPAITLTLFGNMGLL